MQINLPPQKYVDCELERRSRLLAYTRAGRVLRRASSIECVTVPGVASGRRDQRPAADGRGLGQERDASTTGRCPAMSVASPSIQYRVVAGDYFRALGHPDPQRPAFTDADTPRAPKVAIVNQELVRRDWNGQDPVGKIISVNPPLAGAAEIDRSRRRDAPARCPTNYEPDRFTVVGVADDVRYGGLEQRGAAARLRALRAGRPRARPNMFLTVRTDGNPLALTGAIREQIAQIDRDQPVANIQTMEARVAASVAQRRMQMNVLGLFAAMAALLAAIGIYGVMSYTVTQRAREIGIRLALGAARRDVVALVLRQGFAMVAVGVALGFIGALLLTRLLRTLLFDVSPTDPLVFSGIVLLLALTSWIATYVPARRAAGLDPLVTLRSE